jgi:hypothetical protein
MPSIPDAGLSTKAVGGKLSPAERAFRWTSFETLIHEYIHTVEHPAHERARRASPFDSALNEGVTDLLTEEVYNAVAGSVRNDQALIDKVERGGPAPKPVPVSVLAKSYAIAYPDEVADVRAALSGVSMDGLKASYLMGHVEYVGLEASGADRTPVATGTGQGLDLPAAVTSIAQLVTQSGVAEAAIKAANPQVKSWAPLPRRLNVPGWREHIVVADPTSGTVETLAQIAAQRDVTEADLKRHNGHQPAWPTLGAGTKLLIPPKGLPKSPGGGP